MTPAVTSDTSPAHANREQILAKAVEWTAHDPDPVSAGELRELIEAARAGDEAAGADLADRFAGPLTFGTAGLRGPIGGGENRMSRATVIRAAAGLAAFLSEKIGEGAVVVIGNDARHYSRQFAIDTAEVMQAAGHKPMLLPDRVPTPVLAFATRHLDADAGVMVTASHNPPADNGYKVYLGGRVERGVGRGAQIVPPYDGEIAAHIAAAAPADEIARQGGYENVGPRLIEHYLDRVTQLVPRTHNRPVRIVHTALHGVGAEICRAALERAGFTDIHEVAAQREPDPDFPTVSFPNPEEPGALDLALQLAEKVKADIVIANDPDADRCSAAIPTASGWRQLTGDEIGALLGQQAAQVAALAGSGTLASSVVSSRQLGKIARAHGLTHEITLTGFKWISRAANLVFGYEEAIGYCVDPAAVRDKDGISAAVRLAYLAATLIGEGKTFTDALDELARRHGLYATSQLSIRVADLALIQQGMARLRSVAPATLAGSAVVEAQDLLADGGDLPPTDALIYRTEADDRVIVRPSGTEPKLKCYLETVIEVPHDADRDTMAHARERAAERLEQLRADMNEAIGIS